MRKILWLQLLFAACGFTSLRADLTLIQQVDFMGNHWDTTMMVKAGQTLFDCPQFTMITDLKSGDVIKLYHADKTFMRMPYRMMHVPGPRTPAQVDAIKRQTPGLHTNDRGWTVSAPTGKKDTISGYAAEEYKCAAPTTNASAWLTKGVPDYANLLKEMLALCNPGAQDLLLDGVCAMDLTTLAGFPVRTVCEGPPGRYITATVLSISAKPIADSAFDIPADYEEATPHFDRPTPPATDGAKPAGQ